MNKQEAEKLATDYLRPVFGFALKRCRTVQDAEDLSQEILLRATRALLARRDVEDADKFFWTIAHNALSNYYRDNRRNFIGVPIEEIKDTHGIETDLAADLAMRETVGKLQSEIAYLSKIQRRVVIAYYYENKKQRAIAEELGIPLGTVKWHLFEAKNDLKKGMERVRTASELKFNPIRFALCGTNGSPGAKGANCNFFRSALSQNIEYAVWKEPKTVNQIADDLGVSPVYVESEAEYLEEYGFLTKHGERYLCNILLDEASPELIRLHDEMYATTARVFAHALYDDLLRSDIWKNPNLFGGCTGTVSFTSDLPKDQNFFLWALIPYIAACSGEALMHPTISFEEVATIRPDGGHNICYASVCNPEAPLPQYFDSMLHFCGPCWNRYGGLTLWQLDTEWSASRVDDSFPSATEQDLTLLNRLVHDDDLSQGEYARLVQRGYLKTAGDPAGYFKSACQCVWIEGSETKRAILAIGDRIKEKHSREFAAWQKSFVEVVLKETPKHLHRMQQYGLQFLFFSDGWFILHCLKELVNSGKLQPPSEEQKLALSRLILHE